MIEIKQNISNLKAEIDTLATIMHIETKTNRINEIKSLITQEEVWSNNAMHAKLQKELRLLENTCESFNKVASELQSITELIEIEGIENDSDVINEISTSIANMLTEVEKLKTKALFSNESDTCSCFIEINSGAGGVDSQDCAEIILRMYLMWAEKNGFKAEIVDQDVGEQAGIKSVTISINGDMAYGFLKNETGAHRIVRISPFNANDKRQTSFVGVFCYPEVNDDIQIAINPSDLRIDTFRASGAGGQHVNKTDSAVRITHIPSGIVTQSQIQRSQIQNREHAMKLLKAKLYELEIRKQEAEKNKLESVKTDISWGNQIRNYVFHPYKLVKDLRSNYETQNINAVINGDLNDIINSVLLFQKSSTSY